MKTQLIAIGALGAFFVSAIAQAEDIHANQVKVPFWGDQQRFNDHIQGQVDDVQHNVNGHIQGSLNEDRRRIVTLEGRADGLYQEALTDRADSIQRDHVIASQVDYNESVNAAYRRQSAAQFEQHGAAIESNTQAIADERNERQQMGKDLNAGVAGAMAAAAAQFDLSYYGAQMSVSGGSYRGETAAGLSIGARVSERVFINGGVVHDSRGHQGLNAAANWKF